jgi:uncharacterized membrane protein YdjX (TVP38/TMEM64 family)
LTRRTGLILAAIALALVALAMVGHEAAGVIPRFAAWVEGLGVAGLVVFVFGYAVAAVLLVPGSLLTLAAGAVFGLGRGVAIVFVGATLGACAAFLIARYAARGVIERRMAGGGTPADGATTRSSGFGALISAIDEAAGRRGFVVVLLLRLSPIVPFSILNYLLGLSRVRFADFALASVGMLPGTLLYVYYGRVAGDLAAVAAGVAPPRGGAYWAMLVVGLLATFAVTAVLARLARRVLAERVGGTTGGKSEQTIGGMP